MLRKRHPEISERSCAVCEAFVFSDEGDLKRGRDGAPIPRPAGTFAPCRYGQGRCPKGTPENSRALSEKNRLMYDFVKECDAAGDKIEDPIARTCARVIAEAEQWCDDADKRWAMVLSGMRGG